MPIVEYKLHKVESGLRTPLFVTDPGHWYNDSSKTYLGYVPSENERDYYVPDTITELTKQEVIDRVLAMYTDSPMQYHDEETDTHTNMTVEEMTAEIGDWYDSIIKQNES